MAAVSAPGGNPITQLIASFMAGPDATERRLADHVARLDAGCKKLLDRYSAPNASSLAWRPAQKKGDPYFVALTSQAQPVQKTNSLAAVLAFHDKA
mmetsp:Transcript_32079/g.108944  ORF Transcript_32079/g.108944 Transcript_32079/m.108944 type:complete len:96 (+) Transcript_32079:142-429(+)